VSLSPFIANGVLQKSLLRSWVAPFFFLSEENLCALRVSIDPDKGVSPLDARLPLLWCTELTGSALDGMVLCVERTGVVFVSGGTERVRSYGGGVRFGGETKAKVERSSGHTSWLRSESASLLRSVEVGKGMACPAGVAVDENDSDTEATAGGSITKAVVSVYVCV
jgi:hypothetical protein